MMWNSLKRNDGRYELLLTDGLDILLKTGIVTKNQLIMSKMINYMDLGDKADLSDDCIYELDYIKNRKKVKI